MQEARGAALSALAGRQIALDKRRLEAIEQLWETMGVLGPMRIASRNLTVLTISIALQEAASNPKAREGFNLLAAGANMDGFKGAYKARPFVTPVAWALYSTIYSVCFHIYSCYGSLRTGLGVDLVDHKKMENLITATLGASPLNGVLVERLDYEEVLFKLEEMLLVEFRHMLKGEEGDIMSVGQAQKIITLSMNPLSTQSNSRG